MRIARSIILALTICMNSLAQNPLVSDAGMSDPHVRVFNDTVFLYCGHDESPDDETWDMRYWQIWSSTDLNTWTFRGSITPDDNYMPDDSQDCWAGDAATRNGQYYFYFSDRKRSIGVMTSGQPAGPFIDPLGKSLVAPMHDPTILVDDDEAKTPYLVYGHKEDGGYRIAQLNEDMISLAETPKLIEINGKEWEDAPNWMDKSYIFKHKGTYYLSWGRDYAVSDKAYGPYTCKGAVGEGHNLNEFAHGSFFWWKGQFYHVWCYYVNPARKYRETIMTYCHFDNAGNIITDTDFLDDHFEYGVARYHANWKKIQAEWFYSKSEEATKNFISGRNLELTNLIGNSWVCYQNVAFPGNSGSFEAWIRCAGTGKLEIRLDSPEGEKVTEIELSDTKGNYQSFKGEIKVAEGERDIFLIPKGELMISLDYFSFGIK